MTPELTLLTLATLWHVVHFAVYSLTAQREVGTKYALSARDEPRALTGIAGRAKRAMDNHLEGLTLFGIATLITVFADKGNAISSLCAGVFLGARILYLPAYLLGLSPWRTLIWAVGFIATVIMLGNILF